MRILLMIYIVLTACFLQSCKSSKGTSCTGTSCTSSGTGSSPTLSTLNLSFSETHFYSPNSANWSSLDLPHINSGDLGTIPLYSDIISMNLSSARTLISTAETQYALGNAVSESSRSTIPYLKVNTKTNAVVSYEYKRFDSSNNIQAQVKGSATATNGYVLIPFVNEQFGNQMYINTIGSASASTYTHQISIYATASNYNPSPLKVIRFKINPIVPLKNMVISYSNDAQNFSLLNRWHYYFNTTDYTPNNNFKLADLTDAQDGADSIPVDVRFVFKTPPVLLINQKVFVEETVDGLLYKTLGVRNFNRGSKYFQKSIQLTSDAHFKSKFSINDNLVTLTGGTTAELRDIPAGTKWKFGFIYDFNKNAAFSASQNLLTPLKPMCKIIRKQSYYPISDETTGIATTGAGGYYSTCHPDTNDVLNLSSSQLVSNVLPLSDTFYDFFSYRKAQSISSTANSEQYDSGHFYGLREVEFTVSGCVKVYTREASALATNPNAWQQKSIPSTECGTGDFTYFEISKKDDIFNHLNDYLTMTDLAQVISGLGSGTVTDRSNWVFNGSTFYEVIY